MNATLVRRTPDRLLDIAARGIAFATVALFWWIWLTVWLGVVVSIAGSRSIDASPATLLACAAVAATILLGIGLLFMQVLFNATLTRALRSLVFIRERWRSITRRVLNFVFVTAAVIAFCLGFAAFGVGYALGLTASATLLLEAAEQVNALAETASIAWLADVGTALARTYLALAILAVEIGVAYVGGRQLLRSVGSRGRGSL